MDSDPRLASIRRALGLHRAVENVAVEWRDSRTGLQELARRSGDVLGCPIGSVWTLDTATQALHCMGVVSAPGVDPGAFGAAVRHTALAIGGGMAGLAWESGEPLIGAEIGSHPDDLPAMEGRAIGLRSGIAFPISGERGPISAISLYSKGEERHDPELAATLRSIGRTLGRFIEHRRDPVGDPPLTARETEVLQLAAEGLTGPRIAERLVLSAFTVKTHFAHIYRKLDTTDRAGAVALGLRRGLIR